MTDFESPEEGMVDNPLAAVGVPLSEVLNEVADRKDRGRRDRDSRICMCGHTVHAHKEIAGFTHKVCRAGKVICNCVEVEPVFQSGDARMFIRATEGPREKHALFVGIGRAVERGVKGRWLVKPSCVVCGTGEGVFPVPMDEKGFVLSRSGTRNKFLCDEHFAVTLESGVGAAFAKFQGKG
jgi:hypothetical protein